MPPFQNPPSWPPVQPFISTTCHYVEMVLQVCTWTWHTQTNLSLSPSLSHQCEAPHLLSAFQLAGCSVSQVVCLWLRQSFLNFLDWPQILLYLATTVVMGLDYQVWRSVCVLHIHVCDGRLVECVVHCGVGYGIVSTSPLSPSLSLAGVLLCVYSVEYGGLHFTPLPARSPPPPPLGGGRGAGRLPGGPVAGEDDSPPDQI